MKRLVIAGAVVALMAGCASTPAPKAETPVASPTPAVTKDQALPAQGKVDAPFTIDLPSWYVKAPATTDDYTWVAGTAISSDLAMSREKALLDAQMKLADKINGEINALVKQQRNDNAGNVYNDKTSITIKKLIAKTSVTGYHVEDSRIIAENRNYRTFVLLRYPLGDANRLLKDKLQRESQNNDSDEANQRELDREIEQSKPAKKTSKAAPVSDVIVSPVSTAPVVSVPVASAGEMKLMQVDNAEYKARRDAALQKPGAVVGQITVQ